MLIRLVTHHIKNPHHIDKLIVINGLPTEWLFRDGPEGKEIMPPWEPDVDANIPKEIRHLCETFEYTKRFPPIEKGRDWVIDHKKALGLKLEYSNEPGREMWAKIERYLEATLPRDQKNPAPAIVAKDHKSPFGLEPEQIPVINLGPKQIQLPEIPLPAQVAKPAEPQETYGCPECTKMFNKQRALWMHKMKAHPKEKVGV